jgi:hypothetical protein
MAVHYGTRLAQELIHVAHSMGESSLVLMLDYEKTYERIDMSFLDDMLESSLSNFT